MLYENAHAHVAKLLEEIRRIREENTHYLERPYHSAEEKQAHESRDQRLVQILEELNILSNKRPN